MMKQALREADELIATQKQAVTENTDFDLGVVQLPSPALFAAVNNRPRIAEVISDLERGASLPDVRKKIEAMNQDINNWDETARTAGYFPGGWPTPRRTME